MTRSTCKMIMLLMFGWMSCLPAQAVTLGQVQMKSGLGQPLSARIPVYDADDADVQSLTVQLASEDAFRRIGIDRNLYAPLMVGLVGLEPTTPALSRRCSNQLSYRPVAFFVNR